MSKKCTKANPKLQKHKKSIPSQSAEPKFQTGVKPSLFLHKIQKMRLQLNDFVQVAEPIVPKLHELKGKLFPEI